MLREFKVDANVGKPQVAYRETIRSASEAEGRFVRQTGGHGQFGVVDLRIEPLDKGGGFEFVDGDQGRLDSAQLHSVRSRTASRKRWKTACWPAIRWSISRPTLLDGKYHEVDSSELAFKIAGSMAFKEAAERPTPSLLEPVMEVEVVTPQEFMGDVIGDLSSRRGKILNMENRAARR